MSGRGASRREPLAWGAETEATEKAAAKEAAAAAKEAVAVAVAKEAANKAAAAIEAASAVMEFDIQPSVGLRR